MGWNESDNDPWKGKSPPDLDEALKRLHAKLKKAMTGGRGPQPSSSEKKPTTDGISGRFGALFGGVIFLLWVLSGIFIVDPAEQAVILRFGKYVETVGPGPHWIPRFIESKIVANVDRVSDYSYAAQMLTKDENLVAVSLVVQYRIGDLQAYLFNVADPEESLEQATSSALRQVVGSTRLDQIITEGREAWGTSVQETLISILQSYNTGITIVNVSPQPARAPESVQDAFDDAIKAQEDEKRFKEQARAYEASVVPIAEGNAKRILEESRAFQEQVVLRAEGEVAEFLAVLPEYTRAPQVTSQRMYIDAVQRVMQQTSKLIVDSKAGNMLYLPLEKWAASRAQEALPAPLSQDAAKAQSNGEAALLSGRETVRRVEPVGRAD